MQSSESEQKDINPSSDTLNIDLKDGLPSAPIESLCMNCNEKGTTVFLTTKIPYFKDIIISAFNCPHCGYRNSEIDSNTDLAEKGILFKLNCTNERDINRRVVKTNYATIKVPCCGLEIPPGTQKGKLSTIEGFILTTRDQFKESMDSGYYAEMGDEFNSKINELINKLTDVLDGKSYPFEFILDDPSGNSFVENPFAPQTDVYMKVEYYQRTKEMLEDMGYSVENQIMENEEEQKNKTETKKEDSNQESTKKSTSIPKEYYDKTKNLQVYKSSSEVKQKFIDFSKSFEENQDAIDDSVIRIPANCSACHAEGFLCTCICTIPYFKEIIISCFKCQKCGEKFTNVSGGGGIEPKGTKLTLKVEKMEDLNRDLFKSETSRIIIPEIGFETSLGSGGSMFTTVEGALMKIIDELESTPFTKGDSSEKTEKMQSFLNKMKDLVNLKENFTFILDDPASNSFIFSVNNNEEKDERLVKEEYERNFEQNEALGINDMKVDDY